MFSVESGPKDGRAVAGTVDFFFVGVSSMMGLPFVPNETFVPSENRTRRPLLPPFFFGRLAAGVDAGDAGGGGLVPTNTTSGDAVVVGGLVPTATGSIFSSLILICFVGIRFLFAASIASDEMALTELGGIVRGAASGAKSESRTSVDGEEGGSELLLLLLIERIVLVLDGELFHAEAAASTPVGADDDGVFGSVSVAGWSCDDEKKSVTLDCVNGASSSSFIMCSSKGGCSDPRFEKGC